MEHYCSVCGDGAHSMPRDEAQAEVETAAELTAAEVEIARINADRDIKLARINAGVIETEQVAELAHAEGKAEGMAEVIEAAAPEPEQPPVIELPPAPEPEPEPEPMQPPPADESREPRPPAKPKGFFGL